MKINVISMHAVRHCGKLKRNPFVCFAFAENKKGIPLRDLHLCDKLKRYSFVL
jgi:hypothetical protein